MFKQSSKSFESLCHRNYWLNLHLDSGFVRLRASMEVGLVKYCMCTLKSEFSPNIYIIHDTVLKAGS